MIAVMTEISRDDYPSATRFKLQEGGYLLVIGDKDEIAVYAPGKWSHECCQGWNFCE